MDRICVFCGSNTGRNGKYVEAAVALGEALVERRLGLVYGGGWVGLMGQVANTVLAAGGQVVGVIPKALADLEVAHQGLTELHVVGSMHERKALMAELSRGFIALPGGFGTFEELCEVITWTQLGFHGKPCGILNIEGYFDPLLAMFDHATREGFIKPAHRELVQVEGQPGRLLDAFERFRPAAEHKWLGLAQT
jgi:uncharacterized protein (TIGR00730 family)